MTHCWKQAFLRILHCCLLASLCTAACAQEPIPLDSLLFEPHLPHENVAAPASISAAYAQNYVSPLALPVGAAEAEATVRSAIGDYLDNISAVETSAGPFAPALLEQYLSLGKAYQQNGQHTAAIEVLEKAEYISRINSGLFAAEQLVIVENLIGSYLATGETRKAAERQQYLLFLNQQNFGKDSLQAVPVLRKMGDWLMASFNSSINAPTAPVISFNAGAPGSRQSSPREFAFNNLYMAQNNYYQAIQNLLGNHQLKASALSELELKLIEAVFLAANRQGLLADPDFYMDSYLIRTGSRIMRRNLRANTISYANGRNAYMRIQLYEEHQTVVDPLRVARAIVGLGDWNLLFDKHASALRHYEEADAYLRSHNVAEEVIAQLLHPELPLQLPLFTAAPNSRAKYAIDTQTPLKFAGYADVSFDLTRYGSVRNIEIDSTTGEFSRNMERRLLRILRAAPFRPRLEDGKVVSSDNVRIRYYYADIRTAGPVRP